LTEGYSVEQNFLFMIKIIKINGRRSGEKEIKV